MLPAMIVAMVLSAGSRGTVGAPRSTDMVIAPYSNAISSPNHLSHWDSPGAGDVLFITANASAAGINNIVGTNRVTLGVLIDGVGTVCELEFPCTLSPGSAIQRASCSASFVADAGVHLEFSHTCLASPAGSMTVGFKYAR